MGLKICVYAICKNEEKFVDRWYESMKEADKIIVVDTGSNDNTVSKLKQKGVSVYQKTFVPFRFDNARNYALSLVDDDADICVSTDIDEIFTPNWRQELEKVFIKNKTKIVKYKYVWNVLESGEDGLTFYYEKIHAKNNFKWVNPVHEILQCGDKISIDEIAFAPNITLRHYPDPNKSRAQYLGLLEQSIKENPDNDRNTHYLAREYMFNGLYKQAIKYFKKHLKLKTAIWDAERSASYMYLGDCYDYLSRQNIAQKYYKLAVIECPNIREPYLKLAQFYYDKKEFLLCTFVIKDMLNIKIRNLTYMSQPTAWNEYPYELLYMSYYYLKNYKFAFDNCLKALNLKPTDKRIMGNLKLFENLIKK